MGISCFRLAYQANCGSLTLRLVPRQQRMGAVDGFRVSLVLGSLVFVSLMLGMVFVPQISSMGMLLG